MTAREHPRQTDPAQHARQAQRGEVELEQSAVNESQRHEGQAAADDFQVDASFAHPFFALFGEREGERDARDEEEQREDGVVVEESVPVGVTHLGGHPVGKFSGTELAQGCYQSCESHDEEHVEAPQGVERKKPLRSGRLGRLRFHRYRVSGCFGGDEFVELVAAADDAGRADGAEFPLGDRLCRLSVGSVQFGERLFGDARGRAEKEDRFPDSERSRFDRHLGYRELSVKVRHLSHIHFALGGRRSVGGAVLHDGASGVVAFPETAVENRAEPLFQLRS